MPSHQSLYRWEAGCYSFPPMTTPNSQVRRATIEDLPKLVALWQSENLATPDLEKRFKEFQLVEGPDGEILAAVGLQVAGTEARLHSEVIAYPEQSDAMRELIWERAQVIAKNHGLVRLWTQFATPFWDHSGFSYADADTLTKLPAVFGSEPHPWQFLQLKDDSVAPVSVDKEFAMFREMEKERTDKILRQAKMLKALAVLVVLVVFVLFAIGMVAWFKTRGGAPR